MKRSGGDVQRLYDTGWKTVDAYTTMKAGIIRPCPKSYVKTLLRTR